jgi:chaperone BCS1
MFMTTNYHDRLDEALIRPGRVDMDVRFNYATAEQVSRMYRRFFDDTVLPVGFEQNGKRLTMAHVQELCLRHRDDPREAARALQGGD